MCKTSASDHATTTNHLRGSLLLVAGRVFAIIVNFAIQILTVRYLSKADYGVFAFALSLSGVLSVLSAFGMDKAASRFLAVYLHEHDYSRFWGMLSLMFATVVGLGALSVAVVVSGSALGLSAFLSNPDTQVVLAIMAGLAMFTALDALFISLFAVLANPRAIFLRRHLLGPLLKLAAASAVAISGGNVVMFAVGQLVAGTIGLVICLSMMSKIVKQHHDLRASLSKRFIFPVRQLYGYAATLLSGDLAFLLRGALVPLILGFYFIGEEVASYQAVVPIARLNEFVLLMFSVMFLPSAAKLADRGQQVELQSLYEKTTLWVSLLSLPIFAASFVASDSLPVLLFGEQYGSSGNILAWLALGFFSNAAFGTNLRLLRASGKLRTLLLADLTLTLIALGLIFSLVPRYGALGGAWAVCGTYLSQSVLYQLLVAKTTQVNPFTRRCIAPFFVGTSLCLGGQYLAQTWAGGWVSSLSIATVISAVVLILFGRELDVLATFPEISKLPVVRRWMPVASGEANLP